MGGGGASSYSHDIMLVVHVVMFELDSIWVDYVLLVDNDLLAIFIVVRET